jgi:hypothetical protein
MEKGNERDGIKFSSGMGSVPGVVGGVLLAVGVPFVLLNYGQILGEGKLFVLVAGSVIGGGLIILVSAFFGLVMPSHIDGNWDQDAHKENSKES